MFKVINQNTPTCRKAKIRREKKSIYTNKFFHNFHLSESSFYLFRASGKWVSVKTVIILRNQENLDTRAVMILDSVKIKAKNVLTLRSLLNLVVM
jgi:hypothetical protein